MYLGLTEGVALRCAHRLGRYVKHIRDLFIAHPHHIEFHHFLLPLGQSGIELGAAYNAGILAFAFDRTTHILKGEAPHPVDVLPVVQPSEIAANKTVADQEPVVVHVCTALAVNLGESLECFRIFGLDAGKQCPCQHLVFGLVSMDGEPIMLIECKHWSADLSKYKAQLFRYYHVSQAKFGVLTNGINYQFYTDLDTPNKMDDKPFFEIDMLNLKDSHIEKLKQFRHDQYNTYMILNSATEMKYINALRSLIVKESSNPSDLFVKFMTKQVYDGVVTKNIIDEFRPMIQRAFQQYTNDYINERLKSAITPDVPSVEVSSNVSTEKSVANEEDMQDGNKIVTTDEELMGFYIVRAILCNTVDLDRVVDRDAQSYFAILFDDNNRKPICRLHFNGGKKYVETFDEEKKGTKHLITALTDIYKLSDQLISTVKFYLK